MIPLGILVSMFWVLYGIGWCFARIYDWAVDDFFPSIKEDLRK